MADLFEEEESELIDEDSVVPDNLELEIEPEEERLDARRKWEKMKEDLELSKELDDFMDY